MRRITQLDAIGDGSLKFTHWAEWPGTEEVWPSARRLRQRRWNPPNDEGAIWEALGPVDAATGNYPPLGDKAGAIREGVDQLPSDPTRQACESHSRNNSLSADRANHACSPQDSPKCSSHSRAALGLTDLVPLDASHLICPAQDHNDLVRNGGVRGFVLDHQEPMAIGCDVIVG